MGIRDFARRLPFAVPIYRALGRPRQRRATRDLAERLRDVPHGHAEPIRNALVALDSAAIADQANWPGRIEAARRQLLLEDVPLVDGGLGPAPAQDQGITVAGACEVSKAPRSAAFLYHLVRELGPTRVLELGTNVGISSAYIGAALAERGTDGQVTTLDGSPYRLRVARQLHQRLGLGNVAYAEGRFDETLPGVLAKGGAVDLAFIDGHHQYQPTLDYLAAILEHSADDAVFVFDDIRWSDGMARAWAAIAADERLGLIVDLHSVGIATRQRAGLPHLVLPAARVF